MRQKYFLLWMLTIAFTVTSYSQTPIITNVVDGCGNDAKFVELYISGTVDMADYKLVRRTNSNDWTAGDDIDISALGTRTDEFVYLIRNLTTLNTEFPSANITAGNSEVSVSISHNGNDSYRLVEIAGDVVIDQFGGDINGTGEAWEYADSWGSRNDGEGPNPTFTISEWTFNAIDILDSVGVCNGSTPLEDTVTTIETYVPASTGPATAAPDPTEDSADVISMFSGVYPNVPVDTWLTPWSSASFQDIQIQGNDTKLYTNLDFAGIETVANPIDASGMDFLHIDVYSPNATIFGVKLVDLGAGVEGEIDFNIAQDQWVSLKIPLDDFADPALVTDSNNLLTVRNSIQQLIISGEPVGAVTAYVDNVYFSQESGPANDECSQAISLTVNSDFNCSSVTSGTTVGATASPQADDVTGTPDNDVWFSFVATQTQHQISLENVVAVTGFSTDMGMGLYDGTGGCGALSLVDDSDPNTLSATGLTIGSTYFVRVYGWSSTNSAQTTFDVCVGTPPPPPANDDVCDAIALTVDATSAGDAYTNVSATAQTDEPVPDCFNSGIGGSVWFTFVAPASGSVEVSTDIAGGTMTDTEIAVYEAPTDCTDLTTLGAELGCDQDGGTTVAFNSIVNLAGLTAGDTYYVQVDQWSGSSPGGTFGIEVQESLASVQIIHNSADPAAEFVDVYLNGVLTLDDFEFRTATPFVDVPAGVAVDIDIAPSTSVDVTESIFNLNTTLTADETYIAVANGVLDTTQFDDSVNTIDFNIDVFAGAQQASTNAGETSVLVHHGSTDAPTVDVREISVPAGIIVDDISYPEYQGYLDLANQDYQLALELGDNSAVVENYLAPLQTLGLADAAITVVASGFLDPAANQSGPAFGLWVALPGGGELVELPTFTPPPANDDLCDAIPITVGAPSAGDAFTNVGATEEANEPIPGCFSSGIGGSVWFTFDAPASGEVSVTTDIAGGSLTDTEVAVYDAPTDCADLTTLGAELGCDQDSGDVVNFNSIVDLTGLTPGTTYYVQVDQWSGTFTGGTFGIRVLDNNPPCPEPQNLNATNVTTDSADLNWDDVTEATVGFEWSVFLAGDDPAVDTPVDTNTTGVGVTTVNVTGLTASTTYDFYVSSDCDTDGTSILAGPASFTTLSVNDECSGALPATVTAFGDTSQPIDFDTTGAQDATVVPSCEGFDSDESDLWYTFTTNATAGVTLSLLSGNANNLEGAIYDACGGAELFCFADGSSVDFSSDVLVTGLAPNTTYVLQVYTEGFSEGAFSLAITDLPACSEPQNLSVTNITSDSADLNWDDVTEATLGFEWFVFLAGDDPAVDTPVDTNITGVGVTTVNITGLTPETDYDFYVSSDCDTDGTSTLAGPESFSTLALPPANDDVCDAIALTVDATSAGDAFTNVGATAQTDEPVPGCFNNDINGSVWFTFVAPPSGSVQVSTDIAGGTMTDTEVAVYEAPTDCTDLTTLGAELGCDQDGGTTVGFNSIVDLAGLTAGDTYYVQVDQWSGTSLGGTFGIEVSSTLSTESFDDNNFSFYPNPAENRLNLETTGQVQEVKVYNMLGQEVMKETPNTVSPSLNVEALQAGTYIMNVTIDGTSANFRFIKE